MDVRSKSLRENCFKIRRSHDHQIETTHKGKTNFWARCAFIPQFFPIAKPQELLSEFLGLVPSPGPEVLPKPEEALRERDDSEELEALGTRLPLNCA